MSHVIEIKVRGYHLDLFRHVNNARYLEFLEEARWSFLEVTNNLTILDQYGYAFAVVNININYRRAAYMGEILRVVTSMKSIGTSHAESTTMPMRMSPPTPRFRDPDRTATCAMLHVAKRHGRQPRYR